MQRPGDQAHGVPPGYEGCQLALWVRCRRRRRLVYIRCAIPLFSFFVHNHAPLSARYQMIKSSAACLPLDLRLLLACCVCACLCACVYTRAQRQRRRILQVQLTHISQKDIACSLAVCAFLLSFSSSLSCLVSFRLRLRLRLQLRLEGDTVAHTQCPERRQ